MWLTPTSWAFTNKQNSLRNVNKERLRTVSEAALSNSSALPQRWTSTQHCEMQPVCDWPLGQRNCPCWERNLQALQVLAAGLIVSCVETTPTIFCSTMPGRWSAANDNSRKETKTCRKFPERSGSITKTAAHLCVRLAKQLERCASPASDRRPPYRLYTMSFDLQRQRERAAHCHTANTFSAW